MRTDGWTPNTRKTGTGTQFTLQYRQGASRRHKAAWGTGNAAKGRRRLQSKTHGDDATVKEASSNSLHILANGGTNDMATKKGDTDGELGKERRKGLGTKIGKGSNQVE